MPSKRRREDPIIKLFVSAYADSTWKDSHIRWLDRARAGAVDALVTRSDGKTLAIEHTLIEPFKGDRENLESVFKRLQKRIEDDPALRQTDRIIQVNVNIDVPPDALTKRRKSRSWDTIGACVQQWLRDNLAQLGEGSGFHICRIDEGHGIAKPLSMKLYVKIISSKGSDGGPLIRRYGPTKVNVTVEKALTAKLGKLVNTPADMRVLLLERNQWGLREEKIWQEIQLQKKNFPRLSDVDEIWIVETIFYDTSTNPNWRGYLDFKCYSDGAARPVARMTFMHGQLM